MDTLDPARTALMLVHMAKGVAGKVDTPFQRIFGHRAEETGIIGVQAWLLDGFRTAKAKVVYTLVTYQPGYPGVTPNSPLYRTAIDADTGQPPAQSYSLRDAAPPKLTDADDGGRSYYPWRCYV
jgi:nicotinamidase-related amidase